MLGLELRASFRVGKHDTPEPHPQSEVHVSLESVLFENTFLFVIFVFADHLSQCCDKLRYATSVVGPEGLLGIEPRAHTC